MNGMMKSILAAAATSAALAAAMPAMAQNLPIEEVHAGYRETGSAKDWVGIYRPTTENGAAEVCAIYSRPIESAVFEKGEAVSRMRGELAAFINWNEETPGASAGEVSFMLGSPVIEGVNEDHRLDVDGKASFALVGAGDRLYVQPEDDAAVIEAIRAGFGMKVTAALQDGAVARDSYSLMGVVASTQLSKDGCQ